MKRLIALIALLVMVSTAAYAWKESTTYSAKSNEPRPAGKEGDLLAITGPTNTGMVYTRTSTTWAAPAAGSGVVVSIVQGTNITVDNSNPAYPIISATGSGGTTTTLPFSALTGSATNGQLPSSITVSSLTATSISSGGTGTFAKVVSTGTVSIGGLLSANNHAVISNPSDALLGTLELYSTELGTINTGPAIVFEGGDGAVQGREFGKISALKENITAGNVSTYLQFNTRLHPGADIEKMRLNSAGNLGIGITNPLDKIDTSGNIRMTTAGAANLNWYLADGVTQRAYISFSEGSGLMDIANVRSNSAYDMRFLLGGVERMRIANAGAVTMSSSLTVSSLNATSINSGGTISGNVLYINGISTIGEAYANYLNIVNPGVALAGITSQGNNAGLIISRSSITGISSVQYYNGVTPIYWNGLVSNSNDYGIFDRVSSIVPFSIASTTGIVSMPYGITTSSATITGGKGYFNGNLGIGTSPAAERVSISGSGSLAASIALNQESPSINNNASLSLRNSGVTKSYFGIAGASDTFSVGAVLNDTVIRATDNIILTADNGSTAHVKISKTTGAVTMSSSLTVTGSIESKNTGSFGGTLTANAGIINTGVTTTVAGKNWTTAYLSDALGNYLVYQPMYWTGSAFAATNSYGFGHLAMQNNTGANSNAIGYAAQQQNTGANSNAIGLYALRYNNWADVNQIGMQSGTYFNADPATDKSFSSADIISTTITITAHGFGATSAKVNLLYTTVTNTAPGGLVSGTVYQFTISSANALLYSGITNSGNGTFKLTKDVDIHNSSVIGNNSYPTKANQVMLGNSTTTEVSSMGAGSFAGGVTTSGTLTSNRVQTAGIVSTGTVTGAAFYDSTKASYITSAQSLTCSGTDKFSAVLNGVFTCTTDQTAGGSAVTTFATRTGDITPLQADYDAFFVTPTELLSQASSSDWRSGAQVISTITSSLAPYATLVSLGNHTTLTGTAAHGLGTMSTETAANYSTTAVANSLYATPVSVRSQGTTSDWYSGAQVRSQGTTSGWLNTAQVLSIATSSNWQSASQVNSMITSSLSFINSLSNALSVGINAKVFGSGDVAIGPIAMQNRTAGTDNTAIGYNTLNADGGVGNVAIGQGALANHTASNGNYNVAVGSTAGAVAGGGANTSSLQSIYIGSATQSKTSGAGNSNNEVVIGYGAIGNGNNTVTLGNASNVGTYLTGTVYSPAVTITNPLAITSGGTGTNVLCPSGKFYSSNGSAIVCSTIAGGGDMLTTNNLSDVASTATAKANLFGSYAGNALKSVRVNVGESDFEYYTPTAGGGDGGFAFKYLADTSLTSAPANGYFSLAATFATTTRVFLNEVDNTNTTIDTWIDYLHPNDTLMFSNADRSRYAVYLVAADFISGAGIDTILLSHLTSTGTMFNSGETVYLSQSARRMVAPASTTNGSIVTWSSTTANAISQLTGTGNLIVLNSVPTLTTISTSFKQTHSAAHTTTTPISITAKMIEVVTDGDGDTDYLYLPATGNDGQELEVFVKSNGGTSDSFTIVAPFVSSGTSSYEFGSGSAGNGVNLAFSTANSGWYVTGANQALITNTQVPVTQSVTSTTGAGLNFLTKSVAANKSYSFDCKVLSSSASTTNMIRFAVAAPASTTVNFTSRRPSSATATTVSNLTGQWASTFTNGDPTGAAALTTVVVNEVIGVAKTTAAGTLQIYSAVTFNGNAITVQPGSYCNWRQLN